MYKNNTHFLIPGVTLPAILALIGSWHAAGFHQLMYTRTEQELDLASLVTRYRPFQSKNYKLTKKWFSSFNSSLLDISLFTVPNFASANILYGTGTYRYSKLGLITGIKLKELQRYRYRIWKKDVNVIWVSTCLRLLLIPTVTGAVQSGTFPQNRNPYPALLKINFFLGWHWHTGTGKLYRYRQL
jgi:hypothetical protein